LAGLLHAGVGLPEALGAARALYGEMFNAMITLKALSCFKDGDLPELAEQTKAFLSQAASAVTSTPQVTRRADTISPETT
jgi:hypothetical protein